MNTMRKLLLPLIVVTAAMFAAAPILIARAPYESTMLMVQKIFYFHVPSWIAMYSALAVCGVSSAIYLFKGSRQADRVAVAAAELAVLFGLWCLDQSSNASAIAAFVVSFGLIVYDSWFLRKTRTLR